MTQNELAARLRKPQSFVSAYERGQRRVDLLEFLAILDALAKDPAEALGAVLKAMRHPPREPRVQRHAGSGPAGGSTSMAGR